MSVVEGEADSRVAGPETPSRSVLRLDLLNNLVEVHETEAERCQVILPDGHTRSRLT